MIFCLTPLGSGPASDLGSKTQSRTFDQPRTGGSYVPRTQHGGERPSFASGSREHEGDDRQWR